MLKHKLAAILFCDIVGYTSTTQTDESEAARQIEVHREVLDKCAVQFNGEILQYYGDGSLTIFQSVIDAVDAALQIQGKLSEQHVPLRAGIHLGEIYFKEDQFIGDGINIASRIQAEAQSGQVLVSQTVCDLLKNQPQLELTGIGERKMKNVENSMMLYSVVKSHSRTSRLNIPEQTNKFRSLGKIGMWVVTVIGIATAGYFAMSNLPASADQSPDAIRLAVLPFRSLSDDIEDKYLCLGISDDIRSSLAGIKGFEVRSRSSSEMVNELDLVVHEIGDKLNVDYLLEGSVRRSAEVLHINLALIDVKTDMTLAPIEFSANSNAELLAIGDNINSRVMKAVRPDLRDMEHGHERMQTDNYNAYKNYLLGRTYLIRTISQEDLIKSEDYLTKAIEEDPGFGRAYAALAELKLTPAAWGYANMSDGIQAARPMAERALQLSPDDAETQYILGTIREFELAFEDARAYFERAIELDPSNAFSFSRMSRIYMVLGNWEKALEYSERAAKIDPLSPLIASLRPIVLIRSERYDEAVVACREALEEFPGDNNLKFHLAEALTMQGSYKESVDVLRSRTMATADVNFMLGYTYAKMGRREKAQEVLDYLITKSTNTYVPPSMIGCIYYGLGDLDVAREWMVQETNYFLLMFPLYRPLWTNPDFNEVFSFIGQ